MPGREQTHLPDLRVDDLYTATGYSMSALGLMCCEDRVLLTLSAQDRRWRLPGGAVRRMETPADAVRRSIRATTGMCVRVADFLGVIHNPCECRVQMMFEVRAVAGCEVCVDAAEILHVVRFRVDALPANICESSRTTIEAFASTRERPFLVTHRGGNGGVWQS